MASLVARGSLPNLALPARFSRRSVNCSAAKARPNQHPEKNISTISHDRRIILGAGLATALISGTLVGKADAANPIDMANRMGDVRHTEEEWRQILTPKQFRVLRQEGTELPFTSPLNSEKRAGTFLCAGCESALFDSSMKYESGTGWPSFFQTLPGAVDETPDFSIPFLPRTEVRCRTCQGHIGHVFNDGPAPTGLRFCMNGDAMYFKPKEV